MPVHRQWPMFDVSASIGRLSRSRPIANQPVVLEPEVAVEPRPSAPAPGRGAARPARRRRASSAKCARAMSAAYTYPCTSHSAIGWLGEPAVGEADGVVRVLPALVLRARGRWCAGTRRSRRRRGRRSPRSTPRRGRRRAAARRPPRVGAPPPQLAEQHHEQRRGVGAAVVDPAAAERERGRLAEAHLVQDAARLLLGERVRPRSPWKRASVCSMPSARSGSTISAIHDVIRESRPNSVMNHGAPAATTVRSGYSGSKMRSAARSSVDAVEQRGEAVVVGRDRGQVAPPLPRGARGVARSTGWPQR